jgi:hypothetical protein
MLDKRFGATHAPKTSIFEFEAVEVHAIVGGMSPVAERPG